MYTWNAYGSTKKKIYCFMRIYDVWREQEVSASADIKNFRLFWPFSLLKENKTRISDKTKSLRINFLCSTAKGQMNMEIGRKNECNS